MLVLQVGAGRLGLDTTCAGTLVGRDKCHVVQEDRALQRHRGVETILEQKTELISLGLPYGVNDNRAVGGYEGGIILGVDPISESRSRYSREVRGVDRELVRGSSVAGNEEAVGSKRLKASEVVETYYLIIGVEV
jgi:hypothetical protein